MKKQSLALGLAASSLALASAPALADSWATATLGNVHIVLTDLDLTDGITPSLTMNFASQPYLNGAMGSYGPEFVRDGYAHLGRNAGSSVSDSVQAAFASSSAAMIGADTVAGVKSMNVAGSAGSGSTGFGEFGALAANYTMVQFVLSANTSITVTVDATMDVGTTLGFDPATSKAERASSHVHMLFDGYDANGNSLFSEAYEELAVDAALDGAGHVTGAQQTWAGTLSVSFSNLSSEGLVGNFYSEIGVGGNSIPIPVPEPGTYALLLAGLGVMGCVARRRSKV